MTNILVLLKHKGMAGMESVNLRNRQGADSILSRITSQELFVNICLGRCFLVGV